MKNAPVIYSSVKDGSLFRVCVDDEHSALLRYNASRIRPDVADASGNKVKTEGIFVKIGASHAVKASGHHSDAIFKPNTLCRVVGDKVDTHHLPDWAVVNQGKPRQ